MTKPASARRITCVALILILLGMTLTMDGCRFKKDKITDIIDGKSGESNFLQAAKTDGGDLVIRITDDMVARHINPDLQTEDYRNYPENLVYEIIFYTNENMGSDVDHTDEEWQSSTARLVVYDCGAIIESYETRADGSGCTEEWEYLADWENRQMTVDGNTVTLTFEGAGNVLDASRAYICQVQEPQNVWHQVAQGTLQIGNAGGAAIAARAYDHLKISYIDDDTVYATIYDDAMTETSDAVNYRIVFSNDENDTDGEYQLVTKYNDQGTYVICMFLQGMDPLDYYGRVTDGDLEHVDPDSEDGQPLGDWNGEAEIYDGYMNLKFGYQGIKSILGNYKYVTVFKGDSENEEHLGQFTYDEVADLSELQLYPAGSIKDVPSEFVCPYDDGIFEPATPYYTVLCQEVYGPVANGMAWSRIKTTMGTQFYPEPPFPNAWGYLPAIDTERQGHAISTIMNSYDEFGNLVQSLLRIEYDSVEDLQRSYIDWKHIYYPYDDYGVDEPDVKYVNPEYFETERELTLRENALHAVCLGTYENYIYYDLMDQYWGLERYNTCFQLHYRYVQLEDYYTDGSSFDYLESTPPPFKSAVELYGFQTQEFEGTGMDAVYEEMYLTGSMDRTLQTGPDGTGDAFVHDNTKQLDEIGGYMGNITGPITPGHLSGYSTLQDNHRIKDFILEHYR